MSGAGNFLTVWFSSTNCTCVALHTVELPKVQFLHIKQDYAHAHTHTRSTPHSCRCKRLFIHHFLLFTQLIVQTTSAEGHGHNGQSIKLTTHTHSAHTLTHTVWPCTGSGSSQGSIRTYPRLLLCVWVTNSQKLIPPVTQADIPALIVMLTHAHKDARANFQMAAR